MAFQFAFQGARHPIIASNALVYIWRSERITLEDVAGPLCWYRVGRRAPVDAMVPVRHVDVVLRIPYAKRRGFEYAEAALAVTPKAIRPSPTSSFMPSTNFEAIEPLLPHTLPRASDTIQRTARINHFHNFIYLRFPRSFFSLGE